MELDADTVEDDSLVSNAFNHLLNSDQSNIVGKKLAPCWQAFIKFNNANGEYGKCQIEVTAGVYCNKTYKISNQSTSSMNSHLLTKHPNHPAATALKAKMKKKKDESLLTESPNAERALVYLVTKKMLPFNLLDDDAFEDFCGALNPLYTVPSARHFSRTLLPFYYSDSKNDLIVELGVHCKFASVSSDAWKSKTNQKKFIDIVLRYISLDFKLCTKQIATVPIPVINGHYTNERVGHTIQACLEGFGPPNVVSWTSDGGFLSVADHIDAVNLETLHCSSHRLGLVVSHAIEKSKFGKLVDNLRDIYKSFSQSSVLTAQLESDEHNPDKLKLIPLYVIRWDGYLQFFCRILKLKKSINSIRSVNLKAPIRDDEKALIKEIVKLLSCFSSAATLWQSSESIEGAYLLNLFNITRMVEDFDSENDIIKHFKKQILFFLKYYFSKDFNKMVYVHAAFLDPYCKDLSFDSNFGVKLDLIKKDMKQHIADNCKDFYPGFLFPVAERPKLVSNFRKQSIEANPLLQKPKTGSQPKSVVPKKRGKIPASAQIDKKKLEYQFQQLDKEVDAYVKLPCRDDIEVLEFWKQISEERIPRFPFLIMWVKKILCSRISAADTETNWSSATNLIVKKRSKLSEDSVTASMFLYHNMQK